jgi:uncharacterized protein (DUF1330 family)
MEKLLGGEVLMHAEFIRNIDGVVTCTALQIVKFTTEERLQEIMHLPRQRRAHQRPARVHRGRRQGRRRAAARP